MISVNNQDNSLSPKDRVFINKVLNRITMYNQIPYTLPIPLVADLISGAAKHFYKYYGAATQRSYYYIDKNDVNNYIGAESSSFRYLHLKVDPRIRNVFDVYEVGSHQYTSTDYDKYSQLAPTGGSRNDLSGIDNNMYMMEAYCKMIEQRAFDNIFGAPFPISFSYETHEIFFKKTVTSNLVLSVSKCISVEALYDDIFFERYVIAICKRELKRVIGSHTIELPGGATLNVDEVCNIDDIEKIEDLLKAASGVGDIILKRK